MTKSNPVLPEWTRWSWASLAERDWWGPLFQSASNAWHEIERYAVLDGVRRGAWQYVTGPELVNLTEWGRTHGLLVTPKEYTVVPASYASLASTTGVPGYRVLIEQPFGHYGGSVDVRDSDRLGDLLGYPPCCRQAFAQTWGAGQVDSTWEQLQTSPKSTLASTLWRWMGVRLVPHLPCSYACEDSQKLAQQMFAVGNAHGFKEEMLFTREVLQWPVKWSRLFGIAEIVSPAVKISTRTDWTPTKDEKEYDGTYLRPEATLWTDNGFTSAAGMRAAHDALLLALAVAVAQDAKVVDLGCGNGLLLRRLKLRRPDIKLCGIDVRQDVITRIPFGTGQWKTGTIEDGAWSTWNATTALISISRFHGLSDEQRGALVTRLRAIPRVCLYAYKDTLKRGTLAEQCAAYGWTFTPMMTGRDVELGTVDLKS